MEDIAVSVIIPVYGVEKYIRQCLESVINQTLKNIEIIVVNDGTKDNSMKIVEEYLHDRRIKIVNKENGGLSSARNAGLKIAKGKYIAFIDSDDFIRESMLKELFLETIEHDYDIVFSNIEYYYDMSKIIKKRKRKNDFKINDTKGIFFIETCDIEVCNKIYKREFLLKNELYFEEGIIYEDTIFTLQSFFLALKVKHIEKYHYIYRRERENSITESEYGTTKSIESLKKIINVIINFDKKYKLNDFTKMYLKLAIIKSKENLLEVENKNEKISKEETIELETYLKNKWNKFTEIEKKIIKSKLRSVLKMKAFSNFSLFDNFYWRNRIITKQIFRRTILNRVKNKLYQIKN